jgi:geranylgeranyl diphosphate synthase type II
MLDYPMRPAKALRPALCIAACRAVGGNADAPLPSAAAFELFHNAFLVHDDVEDGSRVRRHRPTLHTLLGVPMAVNVGDGMLALALEPLLDNIRVLGLGPSLRILQIFARLARESVEGQMMELSWVRQRRWGVTDREYLRMVHKKTGWYSFISPVLVGAIAGGAANPTRDAMGAFALCLGIAFQIKDDLLSLEATEAEIGKDTLGDLWEGKYTLALLHSLRTVASSDRALALDILARPQPRHDQPGMARIEPILSKLRAVLDPREWAELASAIDTDVVASKDEPGVRWLHRLVTGRNGESLQHARLVAERFANRAVRIFERDLGALPASVHKEFLKALCGFVLRRTS